MNWTLVKSFAGVPVVFSLSVLIERYFQKFSESLPCKIYEIQIIYGHNIQLSCNVIDGSALRLGWIRIHVKVMCIGTCTTLLSIINNINSAEC